MSTVLLKQAKIDNVPIYSLLDSLNQFDGIGLSQVVGEVLNNNRSPTSILGFRTSAVTSVQARNIAP